MISKSCSLTNFNRILILLTVSLTYIYSWTYMCFPNGEQISQFTIGVFQSLQSWKPQSSVCFQSVLVIFYIYFCNI